MGADGEFDYQHLDVEQRRQIVEARLRQYEADHFEHRLNRMTLEQAVDVSGDDKARQLEQIDRAIASLETSIALHRGEQERLAAG